MFNHEEMTKAELIGLLRKYEDAFADLLDFQRRGSQDRCGLDARWEGSPNWEAA